MTRCVFRFRTAAWERASRRGPGSAWNGEMRRRYETMGDVTGAPRGSARCSICPRRRLGRTRSCRFCCSRVLPCIEFVARARAALGGSRKRKQERQQKQKQRRSTRGRCIELLHAEGTLESCCTKLVLHMPSVLVIMLCTGRPVAPSQSC